MQTEAQTLLNLKEKIDEGKVEYHKSEGQREQTLKSLKKELNCKGIKSVKKEVKKMQEDLERDSKVLSKQVNKLSKKIERENKL